MCYQETLGQHNHTQWHIPAVILPRPLDQRYFLHIVLAPQQAKMSRFHSGIRYDLLNLLAQGIFDGNLCLQT